MALLGPGLRTRPCRQLEQILEIFQNQKKKKIK
jgi:hypothetical protein